MVSHTLQEKGRNVNMDTNKYFNEIDKDIENMSDKELEKLLKESGIDKCPYEGEEYYGPLEESIKRLKYGYTDKTYIGGK